MSTHEHTEHLCLCVFVSRNPPVSETVWTGLLQDLLEMQQNVYTCLKLETCHQVLHTCKTAKETAQSNQIFLLKNVD